MPPRCGGPPTSSGDGIRGSIAWSGAFRVASQGSALVAVPILLHALGTDVYAVWVLASSLVFAQGLIDFGFSAVLIRFVAIGATARSQAFVRVVLLRVGAVYALLSLLGAVLWILAGPFARSLPYLEGPQIDEAVSLFRYMAVAFALTNASMVANAALQGLNRIAVAFQAQTIGALGFVPALVVGLMFLPAVHAVGAAAIASYGLPLVLLAPALWKAMRQLPRNAADPPTLRMMLNVGARWQVSNWADFATYQLPRLVSGILLSSGAVLIIDLALRIGQAVATPLFALLPLVLPRASAASIHNGREGLRQFLRPLLQKGLPLFLLGAAIAVPAAGPAIALWSGHPLSLRDQIAASCVVAGVLAHASTGVLSSALLALGELQAVVRYKMLQLALAFPLITIGALLGSSALALGLALTLAVPAAWFNARALSETGSERVFSKRLCLRAALVMIVSAAVLVAAAPLSPPLVLLIVCGAGVVVGVFALPEVWGTLRAARNSISETSADDACLVEQLNREEIGPTPQTAQVAASDGQKRRRTERG